MTVQEKLIEMVGQYTDVRISEDIVDKSFKELGVDSLDVMDLVFNIERQFNSKTQFEDQDIDSLTIRKICTALQKHSIS